MFSVGGVWDRRLRDYAPDKEPTTARRIFITDAQVDAVTWWGRWLAAFCSGESIPQGETTRIWSVLFGGGRRGGKTDAGVKLTPVFGVACPGSLSWIVSESISKSWETHACLVGTMPKGWYSSRGQPWFEYHLATDSYIWQKSGNDPDDLKQGRCDMALLNEGQKLDERCFINARGATSDVGGIVVVAANPPDSTKGQWVLDLHDDIQSNRRKAKFFHFDAKKNPFIEWESLADMADEVDDRTLRMQVYGEFLASSDNVFYNWSRYENEREVPELGDVTGKWLGKYKFPGYTHVVGLDFQLHPYCAAVSLRFFEDPDGDEKPLLWYDWADCVEGNERMLSAMLYDAGFDPATTLLVGDASADWQSTERGYKNKTRGKGSFELLKEEGWKTIRKPDRRMEKNPLVTERVKAMLALVKAATIEGMEDSGKRRLFSNPELRVFNKALRRWPMKNGQPSRTSEYAHYCDAASYLIWYFFPRRKKPARVEHRVQQRAARAIGGRKGRFQKGRDRRR